MNRLKFFKLEHFTLIVALFAFVVSCNKSYKAEQVLSNEDYKTEISRIAPYVVKKPDHFTFEDRFRIENGDFYNKFIKLTSAKLTYFHTNDTSKIFLFEHRDLTSLYEHYRALGGYYKTNNEDSIILFNVLFHTPRLTKEEMLLRSEELFNEVVQKGGVAKYLGNKNYIDTPNDDFYYDTKANRWDYTENSSWKFLEDAKESVK